MLSVAFSATLDLSNCSVSRPKLKRGGKELLDIEEEEQKERERDNQQIFSFSFYGLGVFLFSFFLGS